MAYTFIQGSRQHMQGRNGKITRVVIHATVSSCARGGARNIAGYFQSDSAGGLAHYIVDPGEVIQCCKEDTACWHAPPNHGSIGVELCDWQSGPADRWLDHDHTAMLQHAAGLVADICKRNGIPVRKLSATDLQAGRLGICGHADVSDAFRLSDHTDPGDFPWAKFIGMVQAASRPPAHVVAKPTLTKPAATKPSGPHGLLVQFSGADPKVYELTCPPTGPSALKWVTWAQWSTRGLKRADVHILPATDYLAHMKRT